MRKVIAITAALLALFLAPAAQSQSTLTPITPGLVWSPQQWTQAWQRKMDWPPSAAIPLLTWSTSSRPLIPSPGWTGFNTSLNVLEYWNGTNWVQSAGGSAIALGSSSANNNPQISGDPSTGFFAPAAGTISMATLGIERGRIGPTGVFTYNGPTVFNGQPLVTMLGLPGTGHCLSVATPTSVQDSGIACGTGGVGTGTVNGPGLANVRDVAFFGNGTGSLLADFAGGSATAAAVNNPGGAVGALYAPTNTVTLAGGTSTVATVLTIATTQVTAATVVAGGTGGTPGTQTVSGTTGTGTKFTASVTVAGDGHVSGVISVLTGGSYTVNPTTPTAEPISGAGLTGTTLNLTIGVATVTVTTAGTYSAAPPSPVAQASSSGSGTGATFNVAYSNAAIFLDTANNVNTGRGLWLDKQSSIPISANTVGSGNPINTSMTFQGTTQTNASPEAVLNLNLISNKLLAKTVVYSSIEGRTGSGPILAENPVVLITAASGNYAAQGMQIDFTNLNVDRGNPGIITDPVTAGLTLAGSGTHTSMAGLRVTGFGTGLSALAANIGTGDASLTVTNAATFPTNVPFTLAIDAEFLRVNSISGAVFSVTRGVNGSLAATHVNGAPVRNITWNSGTQTSGQIGVADFDASSVSPIAFKAAGNHAWGMDISASVNTIGGIHLPNTSGGNHGEIWANDNVGTARQIISLASTNILQLGGTGVAGISPLVDLFPASGQNLGSATNRWATVFGAAGDFTGAVAASSTVVAGTGTYGGSVTSNGGFIVAGSTAYGLDLNGGTFSNGSIRLKPGGPIFSGTIPALSVNSNVITIGNNSEASTSLQSTVVAAPNMTHFTGATTGAVCWGVAGALSYNDAAGGSCTLVSAERFKMNIMPFRAPLKYTSAISEVMAMRPVTYQLRDPSPGDAGVDLPGFTAEQIKTVDPRLVIEQDGQLMSIRYPLISAVAIAAIQELIANQNELKEEIRKLKGGN